MAFSRRCVILQSAGGARTLAMISVMSILVTGTLKTEDRVQGATAMAEILKAARRDEPSHAGAESCKRADSVVSASYLRYHTHKAWSPAINLYETNDSYCIVADLAGVNASEIDIRVEDKKLIIRGQRPVPQMCKPSEHLRLHLMEIDHGRFVRTVEVPPGVKVTNIEAFYRSGYLWVRLPKV